MLRIATGCQRNWAIHGLDAKIDRLNVRTLATAGMKDGSDLFEDVEWLPLSQGATSIQEEYVTHQGTLRVNTFQIRCYKASDRLTALDIEDIERFFRGCPHCTMPSECLHCNLGDESIDEPRLAIRLREEDV